MARTMKAAATIGAVASALALPSGLRAADVDNDVAFVPQWTMPLRKGNDTGRLTERTAPVLNSDVAYVGSLGGEFLTLNRDQHYKLLPARKPGGAIDGALSYGRAKVIVGDTKGNLVAYHSRDASEAWRFKVAGEWLSPPAVARGKIIAVAGSDTVYALSEGEGKELWHYDHAGDEKLTVHGSASPVVAGDEVFVGFADGYFAALDLATGKAKWTRKLRTRDRFYDIDAPAFVDDAMVVVASYDGRIHALDRASGDTKWVFPVGSYGGFAADADNLYFAGLDSQVYAVSRATGKPVWNVSFERGVGTKPELWNDVVVVATSHDPLLAIDKRTGKVLSSVRLGAGSTANVAVAEDGFVLALSNYGNLYAYRLMKTVHTLFSNPITLWTGAVRVPSPVR